MQDFLERLYEVEQKSKESTDTESMNIFKVLFYGHEEVNLHSRFISYLLSLKGERFLELFVRRILKLEDEKFNLNHCDVTPNEQNKTEYEEIDILIINEKERQAIIIENKINGSDSIHFDQEKGSGYRGQLERYYNTITKGEDKNKRKCKYSCDEDKTFVFYLSLYKKPSLDTIGELQAKGIFNPEKHIIDYYDIQEWLSLCIENTEKSFLNTIIRQYLNLLKKMTTDNQKALLFTNLIADNENYWQSAYLFSEHFKDVKWHTIHRFFTELSKELNAQIPDEELISKVVHNGSRKTMLKIEFDYLNAKLQIVNDDKGLTLGNLTTKTWGYFSEEIKNIKFCDFSNKETFHIINSKYRKRVIDEIITQINIHHQENYENLKEIF